MSDKEITKKVNLECALKRKPINSLKEILKLYNKEELSCYYFTITKKDIKENKQNLINKIYNKLTDEEVIHRFLNTLGENEYTELVRIINNNGHIQDDYIKIDDYLYLRSFGIVYTFNHQNNLHIIIPEEIISIIKDMDISKYHNKTIENKKLIDLAYSMLHLYGVVPIDIYLNACCKYYDYNDIDDIDLDCIFVSDRLNSIKLIKNETNIYMIKDEYLDCDDVSDEGVISKIIGKIEDDLFYMDYKEITLEDLLKYKDLYYYKETNSIIEFKEYIKNNNIIIDDIDLLIGAIISTFRKDYDEGILFLNEILEEENINITEENIDEILTYVNNIVKDIPVWGNKGWTNKEIVLGKCYE